jgi:hypothetical protein
MCPLQDGEAKIHHFDVIYHAIDFIKQVCMRQMPRHGLLLWESKWVLFIVGVVWDKIPDKISLSGGPPSLKLVSAAECSEPHTPFALTLPWSQFVHS